MILLVSSIEHLRNTILHRLFHNVEKEETCFNLFYKVGIILMLNPDKDSRRKKVIG